MYSNRLCNKIQATTGGNGLKIRGRSAGGNEGWLAWTDNADNVEAAMYATANNFIFANTTSYTERMRLTSTGLGIGTVVQLHTRSHKASASSNYIQITNSDTGSGSGDGFLSCNSDEAATIGIKKIQVFVQMAQKECVLMFRWSTFGKTSGGSTKWM